MAKRKKKNSAGRAATLPGSEERPSLEGAPGSSGQAAPAIDPPRRHPWFLAVTIVALAAWLAFLLMMALR
jgi:hypothetical protein